MTFDKLIQREDFLLFLIATLAAFLIAASDLAATAELGKLSNYAYWLIRIYIECFFFATFRIAIGRYITVTHSEVAIFLLATLFSLFPFVLSVISYDLILGFPELGLGDQSLAEASKLKAYFLELVYLSDNHLALCLLLSLPKILALTSASKSAAEEPTEIEHLPDLNGQIIWVEAQEHYIRIVTTTETKTVLYRFSDFIRELSNHHGMQVHRSHWVSLSAIAEKLQEGQSTKVRLNTGDIIPVSRTYRVALDMALENNSTTNQ